MVSGLCILEKLLNMEFFLGQEKFNRMFVAAVLLVIRKKKIKLEIIHV